MKKVILTALTVFALALPAVGGVVAAPVTAYAATSEKPLLRADVIEKQYRVSHGVLQYRHWNATRGRWVEDHWINA